MIVAGQPFAEAIDTLKGHVDAAEAAQLLAGPVRRRRDVRVERIGGV